jgi:hypothetical protein
MQAAVEGDQGEALRGISGEIELAVLKRRNAKFRN